MKQKDISVIVVIVIFSILVSVLLSNKLIATPKNRQQKVEVVDIITPTFNRPDSKYFNKDSINPTQTIQIGGDPNKNPFDAGP